MTSPSERPQASDHAASAVPAPAARALSLDHAAWLVAALILFAIVVDQIRREGTFRVDDAYITFSFSKNLGTGHGPVFSHGVRVEGYSNFLWMVIVALRYVFVKQGDPYGYARFVAFCCLAVTLVSTYRIARRGARPLFSLVAVALLVCCSDLFRAAASGLETSAYVAAIITGWSVYLAEDPKRRRWSLLAFAPAALMRIDGFVPLLIVFGVETMASLFERRFSFVKLARWAAPAFALWGAYFAWRYTYYGLPLPTTYYAKLTVNINDPDRAFRQVWEFLRDYGAAPLLALLVVPLVRGPRREAASLTVAIVLQISYVMSVGGDWMPFSRFFLPVVPAAAVLAAYGCEQVWQMTTMLAAWPAWATRVVTVSALAFSAEHMHSAWTDTPIEADKLGNAAHVESHTVNNLLGAKELMSYVVRRPGDRLITDYPGVFSVFTDAEIIDVWGLCNTDIALHGDVQGINPIYGKSCPECYARAKPDYLHIGVPMLRPENAFNDMSQIIPNIFHGAEIDRIVRLRHHFGVGRVVVEATGQALWFLERRRAELPLETRRPAPGVRVDYPFESDEQQRAQ